MQNYNCVLCHRTTKWRNKHYLKQHKLCPDCTSRSINALEIIGKWKFPSFEDHGRVEYSLLLLGGAGFPKFGIYHHYIPKHLSSIEIADEIYFELNSISMNIAKFVSPGNPTLALELTKIKNRLKIQDGKLIKKLHVLKLKVTANLCAIENVMKEKGIYKDLTSLCFFQDKKNIHRLP